MFESRRSSIRLSPRRHDAGAALMRKFRPKDGSVLRNRRLRAVDVFRAFTLPMICLTVALVIKEYRGVSWGKAGGAVASTAAPATAAARPLLADRIAPDSPLAVSGTSAGVWLTHIEEIPESPVISLPVSLSREIRVAEEEPPVRVPAEATASDPALRAALHLGDQPLRAMRR